MDLCQVDGQVRPQLIRGLGQADYLSCGTTDVRPWVGRFARSIRRGSKNLGSLNEVLAQACEGLRQGSVLIHIGDLVYRCWQVMRSAQVVKFEMGLQ